MYRTDNIKQNPRELVDDIRNLWGSTADPRRELDNKFWSFKMWTMVADFSAVEEWCDDMLGRDNWFRMFNKFWFTSESEYVMFRLVWAGVDNG